MIPEKIKLLIKSKEETEPVKATYRPRQEETKEVTLWEALDC